MRWQTFITRLMSCSISRMAMPKRSRMVLMQLSRSSVSVGFMPAAGSSSNSSFMPVARARAISSLRWAPYGRFAASVSARPSSPKILSRSMALACISRSCFQNFGVRKIAPPMW